jgi:hypothetical protein
MMSDRATLRSSHRPLAAWMTTLAPAAASTYALDAVATAAGVLLVASQLRSGLDHPLALASPGGGLAAGAVDISLPAQPVDHCLVNGANRAADSPSPSRARAQAAPELTRDEVPERSVPMGTLAMTCARRRSEAGIRAAWRRLGIPTTHEGWSQPRCPKGRLA